ncbi:MAG: protoheme IX farnesyltransferase, partial [Paraglaciecola sp.]|nr:protoheme IX farnesyltransferase [Paraglaciecola sp.]
MLKHYLSLAKPGIIFSNLIAAAAGFLLAAKGQIEWPLFVAMMVGVTLIIASGCAFNNYIDRDIDAKMQRTKTRVLVMGLLSTTRALVFVVLTGIAGFTLLFYFTHLLAFIAAVVGYVVYSFIYTIVYKRKSVYATAIGSISGASPVVIGYLAVTGQFDIGVIILFVAFCLWQIPHSYAIAIYRFYDYKRAGIPVLPQLSGVKAARIHIIAYILAFVVISLLLVQQNYVGFAYAAVMITIGGYWAYIAIVDYAVSHEQLWGRKLFIVSIIAICCFSLLISIDFVTSDSL